MSEEAKLDDFTDSERDASDSVTEETPDGWKNVCIVDLCRIGGGSTPKKSKSEYWEGGDILWTTPKDFDGPRLTDTEDKMTKEGADASTSKIYPVGTSLIVVRSGVLRHTLPVMKVEKPTTVNQDLKALEPDTGQVNSEYFFQALDGLSEDIRGSCKKTGTTVESIQTNVLEQYPIPVPPFEEQRKIASVLYNIDQAVQKTEEVIEQAEWVRKGVIQENILDRITPGSSPTELGEVPENWDKVKMDDVASEQEDSLVDGPFGSSLKAEEFVEDGYARILQLQNVKVGWYSDSNLRYVDERTYDELERHSAEPGDLLIAKMASPVARACILPDTYNHYMLGCADVVKLTPSKDFVDEFIMYCLNSYPVWKQAAAHIRGSGRLRVNLNQLKGVELPKPPREEQEKIVAAVNEITNLIDSNRNGKQRLHRLKQGLMQDFLSGTVRTTDTNIEVLPEIAQHG